MMLDNVFPIIAQWIGEVAQVGAYISLAVLGVNMMLRALRGKETIL